MAKNKSLPWKIIIDILSRLAVKDILRYKCVSKPWCSLIDGPDFVNLHLNYSNKNDTNLAAVLFRDSNLLSVDLETLSASSAVKLNHPNNDGHIVEVLGSCNGLLALSNSRNEVVIWNPSTKRYRKLPSSHADVSSMVTSDSLKSYGFGHDSINKDYKLVKISFSPALGGFDLDIEIEVYSAKSNAWKRKNYTDFPYFFALRTLYGLFSGNALHWAVPRKHESDLSELIVRFDLVSEEFRELPQPEYEKAKNVLAFLDVLRGSLCVTYNYVNVEKGSVQNFSSRRVDIWVMKEYGVRESWTKLFTLEPSTIGSFKFATPVAYLKSGEVLLNKLSSSGNQVVSSRLRFMTYDLKRKMAKIVRISGLPDGFRTRPCVGSLVRLDGDWKMVEGERNMKKKKDQKQGKQRQEIKAKG